MADSFIDTYTALDARMKMVDIIANNLANANTTGFKRDFGHVLKNEMGSQARTQVDLAPGQIVSTGNALDAALDGPGFFVLETPNGQRFTRTGSFNLNADGELVTKEGLKVMSTSNSSIRVGEGEVEIGDGGMVTVDGVEAGTLRVVTFDDVTKIEKEGLSRFAWSGSPAGVRAVPDPPVRGGHLERSNVNPVNEMVHLISAYREFESVQRALKTLMTEMDGKLIQQLGSL